MRKRSAHRPRLPRIPITGGLVAVFRQSARDCEIAMRLGVLERENFNCVADMLDVVGSLLMERLPDRSADAIALRSAALTMVAAGKRYRGDRIPFSDTDIDQVQRGLDVIVRRLHELSVDQVYLRDQQVRRQRAEVADATHEESPC